MRPLFARLSAEKARIYGLILESVGIPCRIHPHGRFMAITVNREHRQPAIKAVALYLKENPPPASAGRFIAGSGAGTTCSALYILPFLALIHWAIMPGYEHQVFVGAFGADARQIVEGGIHRCITALLLHKDWPHVINNIAGLALFGTVAASICGWGVGWFMILLAGATGNMVTALWYRQAHIAIGASTAVFGALGICIALNLWRHARVPKTSWRMWLPLAGGLALLSFLGSSPHSDLMAHLSGFVMGVMIGGGYGGLIRKLPGLGVQCASAVAGVALIAVSWLYGVYAGG
jgi:membrane associated rhomboid family serine protease